jgi:hypothetical protein
MTFMWAVAPVLPPGDGFRHGSSWWRLLRLASGLLAGTGQGRVWGRPAPGPRPGFQPEKYQFSGVMLLPMTFCGVVPCRLFLIADSWL